MHSVHPDNERHVEESAGGFAIKGLGGLRCSVDERESLPDLEKGKKQNGYLHYWALK